MHGTDTTVARGKIRAAAPFRRGRCGLGWAARNLNPSPRPGVPERASSTPLASGGLTRMQGLCQDFFRGKGHAPWTMITLLTEVRWRIFMASAYSGER